MGCQGEGLRHVGGDAAHDECGGAGEEEHVALGAGVALEQGSRDGDGVVERVGLEVGHGGARDVVVGGGEGPLAHGGAGDFGDVDGCGDGEFVEAVVTVQDPGALATEAGEGASDGHDKIALVDTHDLMLGAGGVGQRAQSVEDGGEAQSMAHGRDVLHGGVVVDGEAEADACFTQAAGLNLRRGVDVDAKALEHFGTASACAAAIAVLGDAEAAGSCCGGDDGGEGADVEGLGGSAGAAGVDDVAGEVCGDGDRGDRVAHDAGTGGEFVVGGCAGGEEGEGGGHVGGLEAACEHGGEEIVGGGLAEGVAGVEVGQDVANVVHWGPAGWM